MDEGEQARINASHWRSGEHVEEYADRTLFPPEVLLLARYRDQLAGRVLEAGCGAGRLLGYLVRLGGEVHGIDISLEMVRYCEVAYPEAHVRVGDLGDLAVVTEGVYDAIFAVFNVIDVFDDRGRRAVLGALRDRLASGGVLIFSSHNLSHVERAGRARGSRPPALPRLLDRALSTPPANLSRDLARLPRRRRNRRRLAPLEYRAGDHAILNDSAHDYALLHYYISRDEQERQLRDLGLELVECLDLAGDVVPAGRPGDGPSLHYVARRAANDMAGRIAPAEDTGG